MSGECLFCNTVEQREHILQMLGCSYEIPEHLRDCVATGIRYLSTKKYSDETINRMVEKPMRLADSLSCLGTAREGDISLFRGKLLEWLICMEYNALKNKGNLVMTIVNPDPSSKADLLHVIKVGSGYQCVAGPDVKSGNVYYVFEQWEKIVDKRREIPMIDADGIFSDEEELKRLYPRIWNRYQALKEKYPKKRPLPTTWSAQDVMRVTMDYIMYVGDGLTPSYIRDGAFPENYTKKENCDRIKRKVREEAHNQSSVVSWDEFSFNAAEMTSLGSEYKVASEMQNKNEDTSNNQSEKPQTQKTSVTITSAKSSTSIVNYFKVKKRRLDKRAIELGYSSFSERVLTWFDQGIEIASSVADVVNIVNSIKAGKYYSEFAPQAKMLKSSTGKLANSGTGRTLTKQQQVKEHYSYRHTREGKVLKLIKSYPRGPKE